MQKWRKAKGFIIVAAIVALAVLCHSVSRRTDNGMLGSALDFTRTFLYVGLFSSWGFSVSRRVIQKRTKSYLIAVSALMVFWLSLREFKFRFVTDTAVIRYMWYAYYIPILLIPLIALLVSIYTGRGDDFKPTKTVAALFAVTIAFIFAVLSNDAHRLVFSFPADAPEWSEYVDYSYGPLYVALTLWGIACCVAAIFIMTLKSRVPKTRRFIWLPLVPFAAAIVYIILYTLRAPSSIMAEIDDLAVFYCLVFTWFFESCIGCGLIQSNTRYNDLFGSSGDLSVKITDKDYNVRFDADSAAPIPKELMISAQNGPVENDGKLIRNMPINGGHVVWSEDISELIELKETLKFRRDELNERNAFLKYEYEKEKQHKTVLEQNRLYDLMEKKTHAKLEKIDKLIDKYEMADDDEKKRRILSFIVVLGSYIKRQKDFVLTLDSSPTMEESKLSGALAESFRSLSLLGISGGAIVLTKGQTCDGRLLSLAYDFFEDVTETVYADARYINVSVCETLGKLRAVVRTDFEGDFSDVCTKYPRASVVAEDGTTLILPLEWRDDL